MGAKKRTMSWEAAFQLALKYGSKEVGVGGEVSTHVILVKEEVHATKHTFLQKVTANHMKVSASHKEQRSP